MNDEQSMFQVYDLKTEKAETYQLEHSAEKFEVNDGTVYALQDGTICEYSFKDGVANVEKEVEVDTSLEGDQFYYDSVLFDKE